MLLVTPMPDASQSASIRRFGPFEINLQSEELRKSGMRVRLSGQLSVLPALALSERVAAQQHGTLWRNRK